MANIASQKKRILRSERERTENRLLTSTVKTHFRRLESAVEAGDAEHDRGRAQATRLEDRQGRAEGRHAQEHRRPQEVESAPAIAAGAADASLSRQLQRRRSPAAAQRQRQLVAVVGAAAAPDLQVRQGLGRRAQSARSASRRRPTSCLAA